MKHDWTVPNVITCTRIAMAAAAALLAVDGERIAALTVCTAAALLDAFDGWYARAFAQCTRVGRHLDPLADKILMGVVYAWVGFDAASAPVWTGIALVAAREAAVTVLRAWSRTRRRRLIPANGLGRAKMFAQSVVGLSILWLTHGVGVSVPATAIVAALVPIVILSYVSAFVYVRASRRGAGGSGDAEDTGPRGSRVAAG